MKKSKSRPEFEESAPSETSNDGEKLRFAGSSVNLPDMSATMNAKISVSDAAQRDPRLLATAYDTMATKFAKEGLNLAAMQAMRAYFTNLDGPGEAHPLHYENFPIPLPPNSVRLCLVFFHKSSPSLAALVHRAAKEIMDLLPSDTKIHLNDPSHYHITVYMTSQPHTVRPSPQIPRNEVDLSLSPEEIYEAAKPTDVDGEIEIMKKEAAVTPPPTFRVHRLLMADSGTLLLCSLDTSGVLGDFRKRVREQFPGGPPRQSTIFHASVARILGTEQLDFKTIASIQELCDRWSDRLRECEFRVDALHYVMENRFTTVEGPAVRLPFKGTPHDPQDGKMVTS